MIHPKSHKAPNRAADANAADANAKTIVDEGKRRPMSGAPDWWPLAFLSAVAFGFFWQYFLLDQTLYAGDQAFVMLPFRHYVVNRMARGEMPLWNPYLFGGTPALAEAQYQLFYPPNALLFVVGVARGAGWLLPLHLLWMGAGTYFFARRSLELCRTAATFAALAFAFGGCVQSRMGPSVFVEAAAWLPWLFAWFDGARRKGGVYFLLPPIALAMQLVTGASQYAFYSLALLLAYHLATRADTANEALAARMSTHAGEEINWKRRSWTALWATLGLGVALSLAQLVPQWELARLSNRGTHATFDYATTFSLAPHHFAMTMLFPKLYGLFDSAPQDNFYPGEESAYIGLISLALIAAALVARPRRAGFWLAATLVALAFALGKYNPLYPLLYNYVPGFAMFRAPARWLLIVDFCLALLAGIGLDAIIREGQQRLLAIRAASIASGVLTALVFAGVLLVPLAAGAWEQVAFALGALVCLAMLWAASKAENGVRLRRAAAAGVLVLLALDLFSLSQNMEMQHTLSVEAVETQPQSLQSLRADQGRFWPRYATVPMESWQVKNATAAPLEFRGANAAAIRTLMPSCLPAEFGVPGLTGAFGALMPLRRHPSVIYRNGSPPATSRRWLQLLGANRQISLRPLNDADLQLESSDPLYIYRDTKAMPRAFWVANGRIATTEQAENTVSRPDFDFRRAVVLEEADGGAGMKARWVPSPYVAANLENVEPERVTMRINAPQSGYLVLMDSFYPGWRVAVDNRETALRPANWVGRAVAVDGGEQQVQMWYEPQSVRLGEFLSLLALGFLAFAWAAVKQKRVRPKR